MRPSSTVLLALALSLSTCRSLAMPIAHRQPEDRDILALNQELEKLSHNYEADGRSGQIAVTSGHTQTKTYGPVLSAGVGVSASTSTGDGSDKELLDDQKGDHTSQAQPHTRHPHYTLQSLNHYLAQFGSGHAPGAGIIPDGTPATEKQDTHVPAVDIVEPVETRSWSGLEAQFD